MPELVLVRHAIAFERDRRRWPDDRLRPLTPAGRAKFHRVASGMARLLSRPVRVFTSPLVRARQTAEQLATTARWPKATLAEELAPEGDPAAVLALLRVKRASRIALVGHEPALSRLLSACIVGLDSTVPVKMKKGGIACVNFPSAIEPGSGVLTALLPPRALRRMR